MSTFMRILLILISMLYSSFAYAYPGFCPGKGDMYQSNRFSHCKIGDYITVHVIPADTYYPKNEIERGTMMIDEMKQNCSFEKQIVKIAVEKVNLSTGVKPIHIFNCVYRGN